MVYKIHHPHIHFVDTKIKQHAFLQRHIYEPSAGALALIVEAPFHFTTKRVQQQGDMGATGGTRDSHESSNQVLLQLQTMFISPPGYQHPTNYTSSRKTCQTRLLQASMLRLKGRYVPLRETAQAPLPSRPPPHHHHHSMNGACLRLLTVSPRVPRKRNLAPWIQSFRGGCVLLRAGIRPRKQEAFLGAMRERCRGLPVLRAGCIHPSIRSGSPPPPQRSSSAPVPARSAMTTAELVYTFGSLALWYYINSYS